MDLAWFSPNHKSDLFQYLAEMDFKWDGSKRFQLQWFIHDSADRAYISI